MKNFSLLSANLPRYTKEEFSLMSTLVFEANALNWCRYDSPARLAALACWPKNSNKNIASSLEKLQSIKGELVSFDFSMPNIAVVSSRLYDPDTDTGGFTNFTADEWFHVQTYGKTRKGDNTFQKDWWFYALLKAKATYNIINRKVVYGHDISLEELQEATQLTTTSIANYRERLVQAGVLQFKRHIQSKSSYVFSVNPEDLDLYLLHRSFILSQGG